MTANGEQLMAEHLAWLEQQQIHVSGRIAEEVFPKVNPQLFADVLRREIDLSKYGEGVYKFYFTFTIMENTVLKFHGEHYSRKKRAVEIAVRVPLEEVLAANQEETIRLMEKAYLEGIDLIGTLKLVAPFDYQAFKADVAAIFANKDWYVADLANNMPADE
jgi:hypothetical protein